MGQPVEFLLMDPVTAWNEADTRAEKVIRISMYVLTPHNYVAFCLANCFRGWRRTFLGLAAIQIIADLASCFALCPGLLFSHFKRFLEKPLAVSCSRSVLGRRSFS